jgi:predicted amidohydrolase
MISFVFRKLFLFFIPLMVYSQFVLATPSTVNIAVLQMPNNDALDGSQVETNLHLLETAVGNLVANWKARYNQTVPDLILLPELMAAGYYLPVPANGSTATWQASEPVTVPSDCILKSGKQLKYIHTVEALKVLAATYHVAFATTFLEQEGAEFYNRFVFVDSSGVVKSPLIRKAKSADAEAYYIKPYSGTAHVFTVPYGSDTINIGVGICYENYHCELTDYLNQWKDASGRRIHVLLAPHSAPLSIAFQTVGQTYVDRLNIPVVALANKTGSGFNGGSTIVYKSSVGQSKVVSVPDSVAGTTYIFGRDLPVTDNPQLTSASVCAGQPYVSSADTNFNLWQNLVASSIFGIGTPASIETSFETKEAAGKAYYSSVASLRSTNYWRTRNCTNP